MNSDIDTVQLAALLADRLRLVSLDVAPIPVKCAWPVFKATAYDRKPMFVKLTSQEAADRAIELLESVDSPLLPKPLLDGIPNFGDYAVLCLEWKASNRVNAEDMTDAQLVNFLDGCVALSKTLANYRGAFMSFADDDSPRSLYERLQQYSCRHRLACRLIRPLLEIPGHERLYGDRSLVTIHGDLQPKNYGFDGDRFAAVYDTDDLTQGLACEDAAYAFTERARRFELSAEKRRRLTALFLRLVKASPWPKEEWLIAINHARLRIAARRLESHPDAAFIAVDIARRDKPLRLLAVALQEALC